MTPVVHHYFPYKSANVGDALVAHAIQTALRRHWGPLDFVNVAVNNRIKDTAEVTGLQGKNLERSNAEADLIVIGGSNLLEPRKSSRANHVNSQWHWGVQTDIQSLRKLRVPVLLIGMGTGSDWKRPILPYSIKAAEEVRFLHQYALASAVRDEPTRAKLAEIGISTQCTGCPVTFLTDRPVEHTTADKPLLVSLPPARILKTWSGKWFMHQTMKYLGWLRQQGIPFVATLHERADQDFAPLWVPQGIPVFYTENVSELIARYEDSSGVIGFRLHAALLSLGLGKPIVPVNVDWRGRAFSQTFGLQDIALEPGKWGHFQRLRTLTLQLHRGDDQLLNRLRNDKERFLLRFDHFLDHAESTYRGLTSTQHNAAA